MDYPALNVARSDGVSTRTQGTGSAQYGMAATMTLDRLPRLIASRCYLRTTISLMRNLAKPS